MNDNAQKVKERLNITDVLSGYIRLNKAGVNYRALCPFHNEKTPSLMVSPARQSWHCFGCGEGGDIFTFVEKIEGVEFLEALKILADKAGVVLERGEFKSKSEKDRAYEICDRAAQFFSDSLGRAAAVSEYLKRRGLRGETVSEWRLGYAPDSWDSLLSFLRGRGYREADIEAAGLILRGQKYHDRFRNRLMFPISDINGRIVAFSGRTMNDIIPSKTERADSGKYVNSPETILFSKSRTLYGLDKAKTEIRKSDRAILVEGQMDVLLPWQDGVKNIVASSGTSLTESHLAMLKRFTGNLALAFDTDEAGARATERGDLLAVQSGFEVSVINMPSGKDPADFVCDRPGEFVALTARAESIMSYYFHRAFKNFTNSAGGDIPLAGRKFIAADLLSKIKRLPSAVEKNHWLRELSLKIGVGEGDLKEEMESLAVSDADAGGAAAMAAAPPSAPSAAAKSRKEILIERLLALLLKKPDSIAAAARLAPILPPGDREILSALAAAQDDFSGARSALAADLRPRLDFLYMAGDYELEKFGKNFDIAGETEILISEIEKEHHKEILQKLEREIRACELSDSPNLLKLTEEFKNISKKFYEKEKK